MFHMCKFQADQREKKKNPESPVIISPVESTNTDAEDVGTYHVDTYSDVAGSMDVFQRSEEQFLPPGKTFEDLTPEELAQLKRQYRFDYYKPGVYQGITGLGNMM